MLCMLLLTSWFLSVHEFFCMIKGCTGYIFASKHSRDLLYAPGLINMSNYGAGPAVGNMLWNSEMMVPEFSDLRKMCNADDLMPLW